LKEKHAVESLLFYESVELYAKIDDPKWAKVRACVGVELTRVAQTAALDIVAKFGSCFFLTGAEPED